MRKIVGVLVSVLFLSLFVLISSGVTLGQGEEVDDSNLVQSEDEQIESFNSYEVFWPIVAGKVKGEPLYFLKKLKEKIRGILIFSNTKKADYFIMLSEKRAVEVEKLVLVSKDISNADKTLEDTQENWEKAIRFIREIEEEGRSTDDLINRLSDSLTKQRLLFKQIIKRTDIEVGSGLGNSLVKIDDLLSQL